MSAPLQPAIAEMDIVVGLMQLEVVRRRTEHRSLELGPRRISNLQRVMAVTPRHSLSDGANLEQSLHWPQLQLRSSVLRLKAARLHQKTSRRQSMHHALWNYSAWERWPLIWRS